MSKHAHKMRKDVTSRAELAELMERKEAAREATQELLDKLMLESKTPLQEQPEPFRPAIIEPQAREEANAGQVSGQQVEDTVCPTMAEAMTSNLNQMIYFQQEMTGLMVDNWTRWMQAGLWMLPRKRQG